MSNNKTAAELKIEQEIELDIYIDGDKTKGIKPEKVTIKDSNLEVTTAEEI
tara:strand:- start:2350 stop:2502 length:153 start_codon:yes stop_codon:yes gene_type:complete